MAYLLKYRDLVRVGNDLLRILDLLGVLLRILGILGNCICFFHKRPIPVVHCHQGCSVYRDEVVDSKFVTSNDGISLRLRMYS